MNLTEALPSGTELAARYTIERVLGHGGFAITYLARDRRLDRAVAIKEFLPVDFGRRYPDGRVGPRSGDYEEEFNWGLERFLKEAKLLDQLDHPNVVRVRDYFPENATAYLVLEYIPGPTLAERLKSSSLSSAELRVLLVPLVKGLQHVHERNCLHRDLKPANVILKNGHLDEPVLIDFGAARQALAERSHSIAATISAGYTPLEQYSNQLELSPASDLYSLGAIAYRCLSGREPPNAAERVLKADEVNLRRHVDDATWHEAQWLDELEQYLGVREIDRPKDLSGLLQWLVAGADTAPPTGSPRRKLVNEPTQSPDTAGAKTNHPRPSDSKLDAPRTVYQRFLNAVPSGIHSSTATNATVVVPPPLLIAVIAVLVSAAGWITIQLGAASADYANPQYRVQLLLFPIAAHVGSVIGYWGLSRFASKLSSTGGRLVAAALVYVLIAWVSCQLYLVIWGYSDPLIIGAWHTIAAGLAVTWALVFWTMLNHSPYEFAAFFALYVMAFQCVKAGRGGHKLESGLGRATLASIVVLVLAVVAGLSTMASRKQESVLAAATFVQLARVGTAPDFEPTGGIIHSAVLQTYEAELGLPETGLFSRKLLKKLQSLPTKTHYRVGNQNADFDTVSDALKIIRDAQPALLPDDRHFTIEVQGNQQYSEPNSWHHGYDPSPKVEIYAEQPGAEIRTSDGLELSIDGSDAAAAEGGFVIRRLSFATAVLVSGKVDFIANRFEPSVPYTQDADPGPTSISLHSISGTFSDNTVKGFGLAAWPSAENASFQINDNIFSDIPQSPAIRVGGYGHTNIGSNSFEDVDELIHVGDGAIVTIENASPLHSSRPFWAIGTAQITLRGVDVSSSGKGVHGGCFLIEDNAKLVVEGGRIGPCGQKDRGQWAYPIYLKGSASAQITNVDYIPAAPRLALTNQVPPAILMENINVLPPDSEQ